MTRYPLAINLQNGEYDYLANDRYVDDLLEVIERYLLRQHI